MMITYVYTLRIYLEKFGNLFVEFFDALVTRLLIRLEQFLLSSVYCLLSFLYLFFLHPQKRSIK